MDVEEIFSSARSIYISECLQALDELVSAELVALEQAKFTEESGEILTQGELELPIRDDCVLVNDATTQVLSFSINQGQFSFDPVHVNWTNNIQVSIYPFEWNQCVLFFHRGPQQVEWDFLRQWYFKWFDEGIMDDHGFLGCIHSMSDPELVDDGYKVIIDFGSAPIEAIEDWIETVGLMGYERVRIGYTN